MTPILSRSPPRSSPSCGRWSWWRWRYPPRVEMKGMSVSRIDCSTFSGGRMPSVRTTPARLLRAEFLKCSLRIIMIRSSRSPGVMIRCRAGTGARHSGRHRPDSDSRHPLALVLGPGDEFALEAQAGLIDGRLVELRVHRDHAEQRQPQLGQAERGVLLEHRHLFRDDLVDDRADDFDAHAFRRGPGSGRFRRWAARSRRG